MDARSRRFSVVAAVVVAVVLGGPVAADIEGVIGDNVQEGRNRGRARQSGDADAGEAFTGQSVSVQAGGGASVNATNTVRRSRADSGNADADADAAIAVGQISADTVQIGSIRSSIGDNIQEGDNRLRISQSTDANTGNAVIGQAIGVVADGDVDIVATNIVEDSHADSGNADADADADSLVGLAFATGTVSVTDIVGVIANNIQEGDNVFSQFQSADAHSGDATVGQTVAATSRDGTVDLTLDSEVVDSDADSGNADEDADADALVGHADGADIIVTDLVGWFLAGL